MKSDAMVFRKRGYFYIGRDFYRGKDCEIAFGLFRRENPPPGEIIFCWNFSISWDWPRVSWLRIKDKPSSSPSKDGG